VCKNNNSGKARSSRDNYDLVRIYVVCDEENEEKDEKMGYAVSLKRANKSVQA
jgi:hypothetical protein